MAAGYGSSDLCIPSLFEGAFHAFDSSLYDRRADPHHHPDCTVLALGDADVMAKTSLGRHNESQVQHQPGPALLDNRVRHANQRCARFDIGFYLTVVTDTAGQ